MKKRFLSIAILAAVAGLVTSLIVDVARFPECYMSTWKYQLENDIRRGDTEAVEYYTRVYANNDRDLFGDDFAIIEKGR